VLRGLLGALVLLAAAPVLAALFTDGPAASSYALLALVPLLRGFTHLDFRRAERGFRYRPMAVVEGGATLAMAAAILPAAALLGDHRAMAWVLIAHAAALVVLSHGVASRRYRVRVSTPSLKRVWRFGAPLMLNAFLMFVTFYADRLIVAGAYDWATLALYGVVLQLALLPAQIVGRAAGSLVLPRLRAALAQGRMATVWPRLSRPMLRLPAFSSRASRFWPRPSSGWSTVRPSVPTRRLRWPRGWPPGSACCARLFRNWPSPRAVPATRRGPT
jgi:O-antigen/teichoic acid export membrane protein